MKAYLVPLLVILMGRETLSTVRLNHRSTQYLPTSYNPDVYQYDGNSVEKGAVDKNYNYIYAVGLNFIHVINFDNPAAITNDYHATAPGTVGLTDVSTCGTWVAVSAEDTVDPKQGKVFVYSAYTAGGSMSLIHTITVGTTPDMLLFTSDCKKILVAIEGSFNYDIAGEPFDAEGEVVIIIFNTDPDDIYAIVRSDFTSFNPIASQYTVQGVRWVYHGEGMSSPNTFSQDLEPEYISLNSDETIAYIMLQENNAVATLDMASYIITEIYPLGVKSWASSQMDPSDQDGGINLNPWGIYGAYMPDAFKVAEYNGQTYLVTANEGDAKEYEGTVEWSETQRGQDFYRDDQIGPTVPIGLANSLNDDAQLGRLDFSLVDYKNPDGTYYDFLSYGTRSFSLFSVNSSDISLHWDSGAEFESRVALQYGAVFNGNANTGSDVASDTMDGRSDNSGPEPHALAVGDINGTPLVFIGMKRPGIIAVYSVDPVTATPQYESITYSCGTDDTWEDMYNARTCWDLNPEGFSFIPASKSPTGAPLVTCYSTITSTVSMYEIVELADDPEDTVDNRNVVDEVKVHAGHNVDIKVADDNAKIDNAQIDNAEIDNAEIDDASSSSSSSLAYVGVVCAFVLTIVVVIGGAIYLRKRRSDGNVSSHMTYDRQV